MKKVQLCHALAFLVAVAPTPALAFLTVDTLPWPSRGGFPAYPADEVRPTTYWVQGGVMRDDNILRLENGGQGDTVSRIGAGIRHEQRIIGRQRVLLDARADYYAHYNFDQLDHLAYSGTGLWNWEVGNDLAGTLLVGRERRLTDISETQTARRDIATATRLAGTAGYFVTPSVRVRGGVASARGERSAREEAETRGVAWTAGAEYVSPLRNVLGVEYRRSSGDAPVSELIAPVGTFVDNDFEEREVALVAVYALGAQLRTDWRVARTTREYTQLTGRDFEGTTYRARVEWLPGNKTILGFEAYREPRSILDVAASHVLVNGIAFGPSWAATNKLVFSARLIRERRKFEGDPTIFLVPGTVMRDEVIQTTRLAVGWEPMRHWELSVGLDIGERESNTAGRDYNFVAGMVNLAWRY
jgi:hypothetical protein